MDENHNMPLVIESKSSTDVQDLSIPKKQCYIAKKFQECIAMDLPVVATVTTKNDSEIQKNDFENVSSRKTDISDVEVFNATSKVENMEEDDNCFDKETYCGNVQRKTDNSGVEIFNATSQVENMEEDDNNFDKETYCRNSSQNKTMDSLHERKFSTNVDFTSTIRDKPAGWTFVSEMEELSFEDVEAKALKLEYMYKYASKYSKELLFAADVMALVRILNNLEYKYIIYNAIGIIPTSPCDDTLKEALKQIWQGIQNSCGQIFQTNIKFKEKGYKHFQDMMLNFAEREELAVYNDKTFLTYCLVLAQWAVCAEKDGITNAHEFTPLVICRTIQNLKASGKLPHNFWERISEIALDIVNGDERL